MNRYTFTLTAVVLLSIFCADNIYAAKYTAYKSGNFSDPGIWQGGSVPPAHIGANEIHISAFRTVNMDSSLYVDDWSSILVIGEGAKLVSATNFIEYTAGDIGGNKGTIDIDSMFLRTSTGFAGTLILNKLNISDGGFHDTAKISINEVLHMPDSKAEFYKCKVQLATSKPYTTFILEGGHLKIDTLKKDFDLSQPYNIHLKDSVSYTLPNDIELKGSIQDFILDNYINSFKTKLPVDITVHDKLKVVSGTLMSSSTTYITLSDSATVESDSGYLSVYGLIVRSGKKNIGNFKNVSVSHFSMDALSADCIINVSYVEVLNKIELLKGKLYVEDVIFLGGGLTFKYDIDIIGGSEDSYCIVNDTGAVTVGTNTKNAFFPIGTENYYSPIILPSGGPDLNVRLIRGVQNNNGINIANTQPVVDLTWKVWAAFSPNIILTPTWHKDLEVNKFDRSKAYISVDLDSSASTSVSQKGNYYTTARNFNHNYMNYREYQVNILEARTRLSVKNLVSDTDINIYPNPAHDKLYIKGIKRSAEVSIYNSYGQHVINAQLSDYTLDVSMLPSGVYYLQLQGEQTSATAKFIKE